MSSSPAPIGILIDFGDTLVEELGYDELAANEWLLSRASNRPADYSADDVVKAVDTLMDEVRAKREQSQIEVPWRTTTSLVYDALGIRFDTPFDELELGYWKALASTRPMPGALEALDALHRKAIPMAVVSNCRFSSHVIRSVLDEYGLARHLAFIMVSAEYAVRKPHPMIFEAAARRLGIPVERVWVVGDRLDRDVAGARAAGMNALWLRTGEARDSGLHQPDRVATSWREVVGCLAG